jgi:prepilin-type N-terminal cleavage/methylation domain-containing protein
VKGFSFLEMLIVLAIVGILATIAIPNFLPIINNFITTEAVQTLSSALYAQQEHYYQKGYFADNWDALQIENNSLKYSYSAEAFDNNQNSLLKAAPKVEDYKGAIAGIEAIKKRNNLELKYSICEARKPGKKSFEKEAVEYRQKKVKCERSKKVN